MGIENFGEILKESLNIRITAKINSIRNRKEINHLRVQVLQEAKAKTNHIKNIGTNTEKANSSTKQKINITIKKLTKIIKIKLRIHNLSLN